MITEKRYELILNELSKKDVLTLQELIERTQCSASTIRRDLSKLQQLGKLQRVHGGATLNKQAVLEPNISDKRAHHLKEKQEIGQIAAAQIANQDRVFIDAGSTTLEMIPYIEAKDIIVVTNGMTHVEALLKRGIRTLILGGEVKATTYATIGTSALNLLRRYRFDKVFLGMNGIDLTAGLTTPDEQEALIKENALLLGQQNYVLLDHSKFNRVHFASVPMHTETTIITSNMTRTQSYYEAYCEKFDFIGG